MTTHSWVSRRGQGALWLLPVLVLVAVGAWFLLSTWQENARLRAELAGGKPAASPAAPVPQRTAPTAAAPASGGRQLDTDHATAMRQVLEGTAETTKSAWIQTQAGNQEAAAYAEQLAGVFKAAGWTVTTSVVSGMNLKPGIFFFEAEEESPPYVGTVRDALKAAGLEPMMAAGYRAYFDEKKKENPRWVGIEIGPGQDFALVIGPKPAS